MVNTFYRLKGRNNRSVYIASGQLSLFKHLKELGQKIGVEYCRYCLSGQFEVIGGVEHCIRCKKAKLVPTSPKKHAEV